MSHTRNTLLAGVGRDRRRAVKGEWCGWLDEWFMADDDADDGYDESAVEDEKLVAWPPSDDLAYESYTFALSPAVTDGTDGGALIPERMEWVVGNEVDAAVAVRKEERSRAREVNGEARMGVR